MVKLIGTLDRSENIYKRDPADRAFFSSTVSRIGVNVGLDVVFIIVQRGGTHRLNSGPEADAHALIPVGCVEKEVCEQPFVGHLPCDTALNAFQNSGHCNE